MLLLYCTLPGFYALINHLLMAFNIRARVSPWWSLDCITCFNRQHKMLNIKSCSTPTFQRVKGKFVLEYFKLFSWCVKGFKIFIGHKFTSWIINVQCTVHHWSTCIHFIILSANLSSLAVWGKAISSLFPAPRIHGLEWQDTNHVNLK